MGKDKYYITTAIAYPNGKPHLGHALEFIQSDVAARFHKLLGKKVFLQTGTDEHGTKNWQTAKKEGKEILEFLDENVSAFKKLCKKINMSYDYFIRTTDKKIHHSGVIKLWNNLVESGDLYKKNYKGLYCSGCEVFKTEKELEKGKCPNHPTREIQVVEEENYFFKLSKYKDIVSKKINSDEYHVVPKQRKNEILSFLKEARDISFSRPKETLPWGIPVPGDDSQVMYVWCDALSNYITGAGYGRDEKTFNELWPADVHVIGKDILRFHAAFWPAMLISGKVPLPKKLFVHGFILSRGTKMGKSTGNVVEPFEQIENYGVEQFRFYILGAMPVDADGDYSEDLLVERVNSELVGNLSNFCYRVLSFLEKNFDSKIGKVANDAVVKEITSKFDEIKDAYEGFDFRRAIDTTLAVSAIGNRYFQDNEPWKIVKDEKEKAHEVLSLCANLVKNLSILIQPVLPDFCEKIQKQLNLKNLQWKDLGFELENHKIGKPEIIFEKIESKTEVANNFSKLNLKVANVKDVKNHPNADKLFVLKLDFGDHERQVLTGLRDHYKAEELLGKNVIVVSNLEPADIRGEKSEGMVLTGEDKKGNIGILFAEKSKAGDQVSLEGSKPNPNLISIKEFGKVKLIAKDGKVWFDGKKLKTPEEDVSVEKVTDGKVR